MPSGLAVRMDECPAGEQEFGDERAGTLQLLSRLHERDGGPEGEARASSSNALPSWAVPSMREKLLHSL